MQRKVVTSTKASCRFAGHAHESRTWVRQLLWHKSCFIYYTVLRAGLQGERGRLTRMGEGFAGEKSEQSENC